MTDTIDYGSIIDGMPDAAQPARAGFALASGTDPDAEARQRSIAKRTGLPLATVQNMPVEAERAARAGTIDFGALEKTAPATAMLLADVEKAKIAHDDVEQLGLVERTVRQLAGGPLEAAGLAAEGYGALGNVIQRGLTGWAGLLLPTPRGGGAPTFESLVGTPIGEGGTQTGKIVKGFARDTVMVPAAQQGFYDQVMAGIGQVGGQIAMLPITGVSGLYAQGAGVMSEKIAKDAPTPYDDMAVLLGAGVTGATEKFALDRILGPMTTPVKNQVAAALSRIGVAAAAEGGQEFTENVLHDTIRKALINEDATIDIGQSLEEGGVGATVGGVVRSIVEAGLHVRRRGAATQQDAQQAEAGAALIAQLNEMASASRLAERDADTFEQLIEQAAEGGPVEDVYLDAKVLMQSGLGEQLAVVSPSVAEQLPTAAATGGLVRIPVAEYTARIARTDIAPQLLDHLRTEADGFSRAEAREYMQTQGAALEAELEQQLAQTEQGAAARQSVEAVRDTILGQLGAAGRFTPQVNDAYANIVAAFYSTTAQRLGVDPQDLYSRFPLSVGAQDVAGEAVLNQGASLDTVREQWSGAGLDFNLSERGDVVTVSKIVVPEAARGSGAGTQAMEQLVEWADANGKHLALTPSADFGGDKKRLTEFYKRFGFKENKGKGRVFSVSDAMVRENPNGPTLYQQARGTFSPDTLRITLLKDADLSTFLHETGHAFLEMQISLATSLRAVGEDLTPGETQIIADTDALLRWFGVQDLATWNALDFEEKRDYHERFARGFEAYLFEGNAPSLELAGLFQRFRAWLVRVYRELKALNVELTDEVRGVMDRMLATDEGIALAEQGRSMLPMFALPEESGMTPDEFASYQALGDEATATAQQDMAARGLRDMRWLANARGRELKRLQKEAEQLRKAAEMDARREIMSQPIYRAWQFLTGKLGAEDRIAKPSRPKSDPNVIDESQDSLFVAIAKLGGINKDEAIGAWGIDPADKPASGVFGKPVWRRNDGGKSLAGMAEALAQYGYLARDEHGKVDLAQLEEAFKAELAGEAVYSSAVDVAAVQDVRPGEQVINPDALLAGRLDLAALESMAEPDALAKIKAHRMTAKNGLHPDIVAELYGFDSGAELIHKLAAAQPPKVEIEALTDLRMLEEHGELATEDAIARAADAAIHNEARARFLATEANALAAATGRRKILMSAVREYARIVVGRLKVRNVKPGQYTAAEARAGREADKARRAGDLATAAAEKRNQLLNNAAAREALRVRDEIDRAIKYIKKFDTEAGRKGIPADYLDQIDALIEGLDARKGQSLKAIDKRAALFKWIEAMRERGIEPDIDEALIAEAMRKSYKDMTVEEVRGLVDAVRQVEHLGKFKDKLLRAKDAREFAEVEAEIEASIREHGGDPRPVDVEEQGEARRVIEGFLAGNRKLSSLVRQMDGGEEHGILYRTLVASMNDQGTWEAVQNEQATEALEALYAPILAMKGGVSGDVRYIERAGLSLSRGGRLAVALNWGNADNRQRVMGSDWGKGPLREDQVSAILDTLTREEWQFVQGVWDLIDSYWPQIADKQRRLLGTAPQKVEASGFERTLADGSTIELRGGYYPIKYDPTKDDRAASYDAAAIADDMKRGAFTASTTRRGHTKERAKEVHRPLRLSLDVITEHITQVNHDLAWHEWLIDANRILRSRKIGNAIREHYGDQVLRTMRDTLKDIAAADLGAQTAVDKALLHLRANVSRATMGLSLTTALLQPFGLTQSMARIGSKYVLRGMARWAGDTAQFENTVGWIQERSDFMRLRNKTMNRELYEIRGRTTGGKSKASQIYDASLFLLMQKMQMVADVPTWLGAYEKALDQGIDEADAVALADRAVVESQGGGQTKDLTEIQRKHPMLTMFYSYFSVTYNLMAESTAKTEWKNPTAVAGWMSDMMLLTVIPALAPAIILALLRGEGGDDDWPEKLAKWQASYLLGTLPMLREFSGLIEGFDYGGVPVGRVVGDTGKLATQLAQGEADEGLALATVRLVGTLFGVPVTQAVRSYRGWIAWDDGDAPATSVLVGPPRKD